MEIDKVTDETPTIEDILKATRESQPRSGKPILDTLIRKEEDESRTKK